ADELFAYDCPPAGARGAVYAKYRNLLNAKRSPDVRVAVMLSKTAQVLGQWGKQYGDAAEFRDYSDYDFVDESLIGQGFLDRYQALVWLDGPTTDEPTLTRIAAWVQAGGKLFARQKLRDIDGNDWAARLKQSASEQALEPF